MTIVDHCDGILSSVLFLSTIAELYPMFSTYITALPDE